MIENIPISEGQPVPWGSYTPSAETWDGIYLPSVDAMMALAVSRSQMPANGIRTTLVASEWCPDTAAAKWNRPAPCKPHAGGSSG